MSPNNINRSPLDSTELARVIEELGSRQLKVNPEQVRELLDRLPLEDRVRAVTHFHGKHRLDLILFSQEAQDLVQALPAPELWVTIKEVGEEDSIELLRLAHPEQLQHIADLEWWHQDVLDPLAVTYWFMLLNEAGPETVVGWFRQADEELLISVFSRFFTVHRPDPDDQGFEPWRSFKNIWTLDDAYYLHFKEDKLAPTIERTLAAIRDEEPMRYYGLLDAVDFMLAIEQDDGALRRRRSRLADYGYVEFEEAMEIYQPLSDRQLEALELEAGEPRAGTCATPPPEYPLVLQDPPPLFKQALAAIDRRETWEDIGLSMAALTNRILIADVMDLSRLESVMAALQKAHTFVEIGLARWSRGELSRAVKLVKTQHVFSLFRAGYSCLLSLARSADRMKREGWFARVSFWPELMGADGPVITGLLSMRPRYFSGADESGAPVYREFSSEQEVKRAEAALERAVFLGALFFDALGITASELNRLRELCRAQSLVWEAVLMTAVLDERAGLGFGFSPLSLAEAREGLDKIMTEDKPRRVKPEIRAEINSRIEPALARLAGFEESWRVLAREFIERSFARFEDELSEIDPERLDPRYVSMLVMA